MGIPFMMSGSKRVTTTIPKIMPDRAMNIASCPLPCNNSSCPGSTESCVSSLGQLKSIDGMLSINKCVMVIAMTHVATTMGLTTNTNEVTIEIIMVFTRLMCTPGRRPVIVPNAIPRKNATSNKKSMIYFIFSR